MLANVAFAGIALLSIGVGLLTVGPRVLPYQALPVLSGSMSPAIPTGSLVIVTQVAATDVEVGDVITFHHPQRPTDYVTHRVVSVDESGAGRVFATKGDANAQPDTWKIVATDSGYRYVFAIPAVGGALVAFAASPLRPALFAIPMIVLAILALIKIWRPEPGQPRPEVERLEPAATGGD